MIKLLRALVPSNVWTLLTTETIVIFSCFVIACFLVLPIDPVVYLLYDGGLGRILITTLTILLTLYLHDLYANIRVRSKTLLVQQVLQAVGVAFLFQSLLYYANTDLTLPRWVMTLGGDPFARLCADFEKQNKLIASNSSLLSLWARGDAEPGAHPCLRLSPS